MSDVATDFDFWGAAMPWIQGMIFFLLGVISTVVVERRRSIRSDYELWAWEEATSLSKSGIGASRDHLQYVVNGMEVKNPYEVNISIWSHGKRDIPESLFNGRDAIVDLGVPIVSLLKLANVDAEETLLQSSADTGQIALSPSVVRRGMATEWVFLTDGKPKMKLLNAPLDTAFVSWADAYRGRRKSKVTALVSGWSCILLAAALVIATGVIARSGSMDPDGIIGYLPLAFMVLVGSGMAILTFGTQTQGRRLRLARKALSRRQLQQVSS